MGEEKAADLQIRSALRQTKTENVGADGNCYELLAVHHVGHRRGLIFRSGREVPQRFSVSLIHRHEIARLVSIEKQTPRRCQNSRVSLAFRGPDLWSFPYHVSGIDVERPQV